MSPSDLIWTFSWSILLNVTQFDRLRCCCRFFPSVSWLPDSSIDLITFCYSLMCLSHTETHTTGNQIFSDIWLFFLCLSRLQLDNLQACWCSFSLHPCLPMLLSACCLLSQGGSANLSPLSWYKPWRSKHIKHSRLFPLRRREISFSQKLGLCPPPIEKSRQGKTLISLMCFELEDEQKKSNLNWMGLKSGFLLLFSAAITCASTAIANGNAVFTGTAETGKAFDVNCDPGYEIDPTGNPRSGNFLCDSDWRNKPSCRGAFFFFFFFFGGGGGLIFSPTSTNASGICFLGTKNALVLLGIYLILDYCANYI